MGWVYTSCHKCGEGRSRIKVTDLAYSRLVCNGCGEDLDIQESEKWAAVSDLIEEMQSKISDLESRIAGNGGL